MKHTPGPWKIEAERAYIQIMPTDNVAICELGRRGNPALDLANANLIAAAPELLEALEDAERVLEWGEPEPKPILERVRRVIAKARGG
jgi:hypothetical protein